MSSPTSFPTAASDLMALGKLCLRKKQRINHVSQGGKIFHDISRYSSVGV